jgi:D-alanyl-D-alanine dipeptidase
MGHDHRGRLERAAQGSGAAGIDALVVTPSADLEYLAGYGAPILERLTALIVRPGAAPVLVVPRLERPRAAAAMEGVDVEFREWSDGQDPYEVVGGIIPARGTVGLTDTMWAMHVLHLRDAMPDASFVLGSRVLSDLRLRKDQSEIEQLAKAGRSADESFGLITREGLQGRTERDVSRALAGHLMDTGHDLADFAIVGSGPNGASPHHEAGPRVIGEGEAVVLDFGGRLGGYFSDETRTVSVGEPSAEVKEVHAIVREAQEAAFRAVRPGVPAQEVDRAARRVITDAGYGEAFIHRTGHGIGLEVHEDPYIVEGNTRTLEPGMCFSIEPGIYLQGRFGVRIEDQVAVTQDGAVRLNDAPRDLTVVS